MKSVLLVRLKSFGDILLASPLASEIARHWPDCKIDFIVDERFAGVTKYFPGDVGEIVRPSSKLARARQILFPGKKYELVIDLHGSPAAATLARRFTKDRLVGYAGKRFAFLYHQFHDENDTTRHTVDITMRFLPMLGIEIPENYFPTLEIPAKLKEDMRRKYGPKAAFIQYAARFPHKVWPAERFRDVADELIRNGYRVHFHFGPGDPIPEELEPYPKIVGIPPADLGPVLSGFDLYVGSETGPMHFAAASGCRVVALFGPSSASRWAPLSAKANAITAPCSCGPGSHPPCTADRWCMESISVEEVVQAALQTGTES